MPNPMIRAISVAKAAFQTIASQRKASVPNSFLLFDPRLKACYNKTGGMKVARPQHPL